MIEKVDSLITIDFYYIIMCMKLYLFKISFKASPFSELESKNMILQAKDIREAVNQVKQRCKDKLSLIIDFTYSEET